MESELAASEQPERKRENGDPRIRQASREREDEGAAGLREKQWNESGKPDPNSGNEEQTVSRWILRRDDRIDEDMKLLEESGNGSSRPGPLTAREELRLQQLRSLVVHRRDVVERSPDA